MAKSIDTHSVAPATEDTGSATAGTHRHLPIIDVSPLLDAAADRRRVVHELRDACRSHGFFYAANHGIPASLIETLFAQTRSFFDLSMEEKQALNLAHSPVKHGYEPLRAQTLEAGAAADVKEGFYIGRETPEDGIFRGPNQWPMSLTGFRVTMVDYYSRMIDLATSLMAGLALSLELDADNFRHFCDEPFARLRLLHYPPDAKPGEKGAGAHTDFGGLTILLQDNCGGLQVQHPSSGEWIDAQPVEGTFVVNLGDMMSRWTNDAYRSTLHRVINASGRERYSIPFFFHGNPDHVVACIPTCLREGDAPKYQTVTVAEHFKEKFRSSYRQTATHHQAG
jgi:isopenicillin N synthase-like dioxygenase